MQQATIRHDILIEQHVAHNRGVVVRPRGEGDSRFAVFERALDGVAAACAIQLALHQERWPLSEPLKVRLAVHTGDTGVREGDYYGLAVNLCSRLRAIAYGGQVLISGTTAAIVRDQLPNTVRLRELGTYSLRYVSEPETVFQLVHPDLPSEFPPLLADTARRRMLPTQATPLIGRDTELQDLQRLLLRPDVRLITIVGVGGVGKTRLAVAVASHVQSTFEDGALFVDLSAIREPALVMPTLAAALGVRELGGQTALERFETVLHERRTLVVLDNCEQLLGMATDLSQVLATCPGIKLLATSREPLRLRWEHTFPLQPLPVPAQSTEQTPQMLAQVASVALFLERAHAADSSLTLEPENVDTIAALCRRLDGLPLAIELAAARVRTIPPRALLSHLGVRLDMFKGARDAPPRHQSLQAAIAWSYDLLSPDEQVLFRRLSVFAGGCTTEAILEVHGAAALEDLSSLVDKSLLLLAGPGAPDVRYRMLETVRTYAREQLVESGEHHVIQLRHASYFLGLSERAARAIGGEQLAWLDQLDLEHENLRTALGWTLETQSSGTALRLASALNWFWRVRGNLNEGKDWLERALAGAPDTANDERAAALQALGFINIDRGDLEAALTQLDLSRELLRASGGIQGSPATLVSIAYIAAARSDYERATVLARGSLKLSRELGDRTAAARSIVVLANVARHRGNYEDAVPLYAESEAIVRAIGDSRELAGVLHNQAQLELYRGDYQRSRTLAEESHHVSEKVGDRLGVANALGCLGEIASDLGNEDIARKLFTEEMAILQEVGPKRYIAATLISCATVSEDYVEALHLLQQALVALREVGDRRSMATGFLRLALAARRHGHSTESARVLGAADALQRKTGAAYRLKFRDEDRALRTQLREDLGDETFAELLAEGARLTAERAVEYALTLS